MVAEKIFTAVNIHLQPTPLQGVPRHFVEDAPILPEKQKPIQRLPVKPEPLPDKEENQQCQQKQPVPFRQPREKTATAATCQQSADTPAAEKNQGKHGIDELSLRQQQKWNHSDPDNQATDHPLRRNLTHHPQYSGRSNCSRQTSACQTALGRRDNKKTHKVTQSHSSQHINTRKKGKPQ
ncbi:hypothetical protein [uncultured Victivallis sp.]|uniref:hypothetical protein n=1 Tax=Victivallis sp. TaxID=2049020 RepID=UPI0025DC8DBE|nr:hypothetical protein [uncultured Victivallis sp.]